MTGVLADWIQDGLGSWWAPGLAFAAGLISFASPCVFPLVPGYLSFVAGGEVREEKQPVVPILLFIAGFAAVFSALGAFTGAMTRFLRSSAGIRISGAIIIAFGLLMLLYALRLGSPTLFAERRPLLDRVQPGRAWAFPLGVAFGAGWTPCIGPVLAGVLAIAGSQGGSLRGALLLFVYSLGLGLPFLLVGVGLRKLMPSPSYFPIVAAFGLPVIGYGLIFALPAVIVVGAAVTLAGFFGWALEPSAE